MEDILNRSRRSSHPLVRSNEKNSLDENIEQMLTDGDEQQQEEQLHHHHHHHHHPHPRRHHQHQHHR
jgi:hypothetical protein